jgi:hypothetical protein
MDSLTPSPNSLLNLLMDSQGGASSSIPVNIVLGHLGFQKNASRLWKNAQFQFLLDICEEKLWEYNQKPFRKQIERILYNK